MSKPTSVLLYRMIYYRNESSFAWWNGREWSADGEIHDTNKLCKMLKTMGATMVLREHYSPTIHMCEIWALGGQ